jgi:hypothetical protein
MKPRSTVRTLALSAAVLLASSRVASVRAEPPSPPPPSPPPPNEPAGPPRPPPGVALGCTPVPKEAMQSIFLTGDSSVGYHDGLTRGLDIALKPMGVTFSAEPYSSQGIHAFANLDKWQLVMKQRKPKLVIISLGMNNVYTAKPETLAPAVKKIVSTIQPLECVWLAPPLWRGEYGVTDVIRKNVAPCRFFDSNKMKIERGSDKIHPSNKGGEVWADAVVKYLTQCIEPGSTPPTQPAPASPGAAPAVAAAANR